MIDSSPERRLSGRLPGERRRAQILETAATFFSEKGFPGSTRELASALGVTQALLYRYFPSKEALIEEVFQSTLIPRLSRAVAEVLERRSMPLAERIVTLYEQLIADDDGRPVRLYFRAALDGHSVVAHRRNQLVGQVFLPLVRELREELGLPSLDEAPLKTGEAELVMMLHGSIAFHSLRQHVFEQPVADRRAVYALYVRAFLTTAREVLKELHSGRDTSVLAASMSLDGLGQVPQQPAPRAAAR